MRAKTRALLALAMIAALLVTSSPVGASSRGASKEPAPLEGDDAVRATAEIVAKSQGISVDMSIEVLKHQESMDLLQESIHDLDPEAYGGSVHDLLPAIGTTIFVKGPISADAERLARGYDNVRLESSNVSLDDIRLASEQAAQTLSRAGFKDIGVGADTRNRTIEVELSNDELTSLDVRLAELEGAFQSSVLPVNISVYDGQVQVDTAVYGGGQLGTVSSNKCTAAFVVTKNGANGVLTAKHCGYLSRYRTGSHKTLTYQGSALNSLGDVKWYTTSGTEDDRFYYTHTATKDVSGLKNHLYMDVGDLVCRYGRKTGNGGCEDIVQLFVSGGGYGSLVRVDSTNDDLGDSGGPWYNGTTAWGVHKGHFTSNHDGVFSAVSIVDGNMGVTLKTS